MPKYPEKPWKVSLAFENNAPNFYAVRVDKWGAPLVAKVFSEDNAKLFALSPLLLATL